MFAAHDKRKAFNESSYGHWQEEKSDTKRIGLLFAPINNARFHFLFEHGSDCVFILKKRY